MPSSTRMGMARSPCPRSPHAQGIACIALAWSLSFELKLHDNLAQQGPKALIAA